MKKIFALILAVIILLSASGIAAIAADNTPEAMIDGTPYNTLQLAVDAVRDGTDSGLIQLNQDVKSEVIVQCDVDVDLNGHDIDKVTVNEGVFYALDSQTSDFEAKTEDDYGVIRSYNGNVQAFCSPEEEGCGWLMFDNDGTNASFHYVVLQITDMALQAKTEGEKAYNPNLYYKCTFKGDDIIAQNVKTFGVALSITEVPNSENLKTKCGYSVFENFQPGANGNPEQSTSTVLKGIMKESQASLINKRNANMPIYGRAYLELANGAYVFGEIRERTLKKQIIEFNKDWASYTDQNHKDVAMLYRRYTSTMKDWNVQNIESAVVRGEEGSLLSGKTLKVLAITSSFGLNTTQFLYDVAVAEGYAPEDVIVARLYTSGCTLEKHLRYAPDKPVYQYSKVSADTDGKLTKLMEEGTATLLDGLLDEEWDIIFMQQGAAQSPQLSTYKDYIDQLRNIINPYVEEHCPNAKFIWNMLWAYQYNSTESVFVDIFNSDQMYMYRSNVAAVQKFVVPRTDYDRIIPSGTVIQNARTSFFGDRLSRDRYHLNDLGGILAAYGLFATITGQHLTEINIDAVTASANNHIGGSSITEPLTNAQKLVIMESVNNALDNPFGVTESIYKTAE